MLTIYCVQSIMKSMEIVESPFMSIIADLAKNNKNLTPALQNAIAKFLELESTPKLVISRPFDEIDSMFADHNRNIVLTEDLDG